MGFGKYLGATFKKIATAPVKAAIAPVKKTISSTKDLASGNVKGAVSKLNIASPSNVKAGVKAFRSYADPLAKAKPKPAVKPMKPAVEEDTYGA